MNKILALLLVLAMACSLVACGGSKVSETPPPSTPAVTEKPTATPTEPEEILTGKTIELSVWSLIYDPEIWTVDEAEIYEYDDYASAILVIPDDEAAYSVRVEITAALEDAEAFRDYLDSYGFDAYEYAVNNSYSLVNVGGVDCLTQEGDFWGDPCLRYLGRDEAAAATVLVEILGDYNDPQVAQLLKGLSFHTEDIGNEDFPWPWDGEPFSAPNASAMAGTYTVNSQWLPISECLLAKDAFTHDVAVANGMACIVGDGVLKQYAYDGTSLAFRKDIDISGDYSYIQSTDDGSVWISGFMDPLVSMVDGVQTGSYEGPDYVTMHHSGQWGISWFSGPECQKITMSPDGTISYSDITFAEVSNIATLVVDDDYIYVCGQAADDSGHKVFIYNTDGTLQKVLTDADGDCLGCITFIAQTPNGFLGLDGNMREIVLWTPDGTHIGTIDDTDLFGTSYPWFCSATLLDDGSILVIMTEDRADQSAMELVAFRLSGF